MNSLALLVQEAFTRDRHGGDLYAFRDKCRELLKRRFMPSVGARPLPVAIVG
ncbi:hypothetical protein [Bradyrhizobium sp. 171]|nr:MULTISPECIES: hypothetical protein [unclassified Bradyrhizobium]